MRSIALRSALRSARHARILAATSVAAGALLAIAPAASAASKAVPGTNCTITATAPGPSFGGGISCGAGSHDAAYVTCVQVQNATGSWSNTSTCGADHSRLSRSGMGTSFVGFHQASGRSYRVATFGGADGHVAIVISAGFGTTTIG
jgi:hypothetical protein